MPASSAISIAMVMKYPGAKSPVHTGIVFQAIDKCIFICVHFHRIQYSRGFGMLLKFVETVVFCVTGLYCGWRFLVSLRNADEKVTVSSIISGFRYFLLFTFILMLFGIYDVWFGSTLTPFGYKSVFYIDILGTTVIAFWGGFHFARLRSLPYSKKRRMFDSISLVCIIISVIMLSFVQGI